MCLPYLDFCCQHYYWFSMPSINAPLNGFNAYLTDYISSDFSLTVYLSLLQGTLVSLFLARVVSSIISDTFCSRCTYDVACSFAVPVLNNLPLLQWLLKESIFKNNTQIFRKRYLYHFKGIILFATLCVIEIFELLSNFFIIILKLFFWNNQYIQCGG